MGFDTSTLKAHLKTAGFVTSGVMLGGAVAWSLWVLALAAVGVLAAVLISMQTAFHVLTYPSWAIAVSTLSLTWTSVTWCILKSKPAKLELQGRILSGLKVMAFLVLAIGALHVVVGSSDNDVSSDKAQQMIENLMAALGGLTVGLTWIALFVVPAVLATISGAKVYSEAKRMNRHKR